MGIVMLLQLDSLINVNSEYRIPDNEIQFLNSINKTLKEENNLLELKINVLIQFVSFKRIMNFYFKWIFCQFVKLSAEVELSHKEYKELNKIWSNTNPWKSCNSSKISYEIYYFMLFNCWDFFHLKLCVFVFLFGFSFFILHCRDESIFMFLWILSFMYLLGHIVLRIFCNYNQELTMLLKNTEIVIRRGINPLRL